MFTHLTPADLTPREVYKLMIGCVVPRPIAWITSLNDAGVVNLAPFSYFNGVSSQPAVVSVSFSYHPERPEKAKDTLRNIRATGEFVINVVSEPNEVAMHGTSGEYPPETSELVLYGLTEATSRKVRPPSVGESPIRLECALYDTVQVGSGPGSATLVLGEVVNISVRDDLIDERLHIDHKAMKPVGRLAGSNYAFIHEIVDLGPRP
ncbi:MAG: flavin reductase family protein [bacterium]